MTSHAHAIPKIRQLLSTVRGVRLRTHLTLVHKVIGLHSRRETQSTYFPVDLIKLFYEDPDHWGRTAAIAVFQGKIPAVDAFQSRFIDSMGPLEIKFRHRVFVHHHMDVKA